ncbi:MAG: hypothetical protein AAF806_01495 [Bacteroidota bacterium]
MIRFLSTISKYCFFLLSLCLPILTHATSKQTKYVTFLLKQRLILIDVVIAEEQGYFLLDTGMDDLILNQNYFEGTASGQSVTGLNQEISNLETTLVNLEMGNLTFSGKRGKIMDLSFLENHLGEKVMGICGVRLFQKYEWVIHYRKGVIELFPLNKKGIPMDQDKELPDQILPLRKQRHLLFVEAKLGQQSLMLGMDTGASTTLIDDQNLVLNNYEVRGQCRVQSIGGKPIITESGILKQLEIGRVKLDKTRISRTSLKYINQKYAGISVDGIFNPIILRRGTIGINWKQKLLYIWEDAEKEEDIIIAELVEF